MARTSPVVVDCRHATANDLPSLRREIYSTLQLHHCVHLLLPNTERASSTEPSLFESLNTPVGDSDIQSTLHIALSFCNFANFSLQRLISPSWPYDTLCEVFRVEDASNANSNVNGEDGKKVIHAAYSTSGLPLHTDMPYLPTPPHYQLLHCIQPAADGGVNTFVNARAVIDDLRCSEPDLVNLLSSQPVRFSAAAGMDHVSESIAPALQLNHDSTQLQCLRLGQTHVAVPGTPSPADSIEDPQMRQQWLHAVDSLYQALMHAPTQQRHQIHLQANQAVLFNNHLMVHDRSSFTSTDRRMHGVYISSDALQCP